MVKLSDYKQLPLVLGITGASGAVYGFRLLKFFLENNFNIDLVISKNACKVAELEIDLEIDNLSLVEQKSKILKYLQSEDFSKSLTLWGESNIAASISSGSYKTQGMIIAPCSMGTLASIAMGSSNNLIARAADVTLKERRRLVLVARETPLSSIHLRNMLSLSEMGTVILPAAPGFYHKPTTINEQIDFVLGKTLDVFDIDNQMFKRWTDNS